MLDNYGLVKKWDWYQIKKWLESLWISRSVMGWDVAMAPSPIQKKNGPLTTEIAILNLENSRLKFPFYV